MRDRYPSVINLGTHPLIISSQNIQKSVFLVCNHSSQKIQKSQRTSQRTIGSLSGTFMRTARFFKDFEITDGYLILKSFQRTRTESSLILERTRTSNSLKIQRAAQHWFILHTRSTLPQHPPYYLGAGSCIVRPPPHGFGPRWLGILGSIITPAIGAHPG
jgi:hypothetical protein